uniref:Heparan-alpha-glucosaminide N-acetyltransferase catalytic domain-containing protein n=1 Tax=viral metagenome TaxID=1070528 RepID=A0A6C0H6Z3_9ZZZZ
MNIIFIDNLRGIAFILMLIHHIIYFYDNSYNTDYLSKYTYVNYIGQIARILFIFLAGYSLELAYKKYSKYNKFIYKKIQRIFEIILYALLITIVTYYYYPDKFIRFGILHFISIASLLLTPLIPFKKLFLLLFVIIIFLYKNIYKLPLFHPFINTILGTRNYWNSMDYFPLLFWLPLMMLGVLISSLNLNLEKHIKSNILNKKNILTWLGTNSLKLYLYHIVILIILYKIIKI